VQLRQSGQRLQPATRSWPALILSSPSERGAALIKIIPLVALAAIALLAICRQGHDSDDASSNSSGATPSSQSPFEEVAQRTQEARHGVPTGVPLRTEEDHFLTAYEQVGLGIALVLAIGLGSRMFTSGRGAALIKRFNPWAAVTASLQATEEQSVAEFATQLQIVERGNAEMARSREEILTEFFQQGDGQLEAFRNTFAEISRSTDPSARQKTLNKLCADVASFKTRVGTLELRPAWQLATGLERLLTQLAEKEANVTPSTLRTAAGAILLLKNLCIKGVRNDLVTDPPVCFLAVDDDPISRRAVSMALKKVGHAPDVAENGEAALELAARQAYDAVFLDVEMPGLDGFEVCTRIHKLTLNQATPVIFVTSHSDFESRAKSTSSGGRDLIAKPFLSSEITLKALTVLLRGRLEREKVTAELPEKPAPPAKPKHSPPEEPTKERLEAALSGNTKEAANPLLNARASAKSNSATRAGIDADSKQRSTGSPSTAEFASAFVAQAPEHLTQMQQQLSAIKQAENPAQRGEFLGELYVGVHVLTSEATRAGFRVISEVGVALENVIRKLLDKPQLWTPSAVAAIGEAIGLVEELAPGGIEPDFANPPIRALVVDDEPLTRRAISNALQLTFEKPDNADCGEAALALAEQKPFDVIFLDILMPGMDGFETCEKIRETRQNGQTPIVFVTSRDDKESREKTVSCGGNGFISKPVLPAEIFLTALTSTLRARMGNKKATASAEMLEEAVC
jgi:CheY-like chemotaxis protein